jgi:hypothetical protein
MILCKQIIRKDKVLLATVYVNDFSTIDLNRNRWTMVHSNITIKNTNYVLRLYGPSTSKIKYAAENLREPLSIARSHYTDINRCKYFINLGVVYSMENQKRGKETYSWEW